MRGQAETMDEESTAAMNEASYEEYHFIKAGRLHRQLQRRFGFGKAALELTIKAPVLNRSG